MLLCLGQRRHTEVKWLSQFTVPESRVWDKNLGRNIYLGGDARKNGVGVGCKRKTNKGHIHEWVIRLSNRVHSHCGPSELLNQGAKKLSSLPPKSHPLFTLRQRDTLIRTVGVGTSLADQWLRLHASTVGGVGLIPGEGTKIPHAMRCSQKKNKSQD